jgi:hypothetical protein
MLAKCLPHWEAAMGSCFHFELAVRLLAQKFFAGESVTRDIGDRPGRDGLLTMLFGRVPFDEGERAFLPKCNTLRNKLIHCEPDALLRVIRELAPDFRPPSLVQQVEIGGTGSGAEILRALETLEGAVDVMTTTSRAEGFVGWMLQAAADGTFRIAVELLQRGMDVLDSKLACA